MLRKLHKPVVVPDMNYLQSLSNGQEYLSAKYFWVWPIAIFSEASSKGNRSEAYLKKMMRTYLLNNERCAMSREAHSFCDLSITMSDKLDWDMVIDADLTQAIGIACESNATERLMDRLAVINSYRDEKHNDFWLILKHLKNQDSSVADPYFYQSIEHDREAITTERAKEFFLQFSAVLGRDESSDNFFITQHKSSSPLVTLSKLLLYIRMRWSVKELSKKELNDYDDVSYALLASVTRHIATSDGGLTRMLKVCCPQVKFHTPRLAA